MPRLSIVITCYTLERLNDVQNLLDSIKAQTYPDIETIFVAERSVELYGQMKVYVRERNIPNTRVISNDGEMGLSAARNLGIKEAEGDIIAFVDDDTILFPDWAQEMVKAYTDDSIIGVTGPALPRWEDESVASWFPEEFYWIVSCTAWSGWKEVKEVRNAWGQGMSFRRVAFEECGFFLNEFGFHKGPLAEDNEFSLRVRSRTGKRIIYCPTVRLWHQVHRYRLSQRFIRERAYWIGYSRRMLRRLYAEADTGKDLLSQEHELLRRIACQLWPSILRSFFTNPTAGWRKLRISVTALAFVALGYYSHLLPGRWGRAGGPVSGISAVKHNH